MKTPIYMTVQNLIMQYIKEKKLEPGSKLPTFREFAGLCNTSIYTVSTAVENLQNRGILEVLPQSGVYVAGNAWQALHPDELEWGKYLYDGKPYKSISVRNYAFIESRMNLSYPIFNEIFGWFPVLQNAVAKAMNSISNPDELSNLEGGQGYTPLRIEVSEFIKNYGITASPENILITGGTYNGLFLVAATFLAPGDIFFIPSPSLEELDFITRRFTGVERVPVPFDAEGMSAEYIASKINRRKKSFVMVSPVIQSHYGATMSLRRRRELYDLCYKNKMPIFEIDEYRDFHPNPQPPIKTMDRHNIVIHMGTFSRVLSRSVNVGWIAAPANLVEKLVLANTSLFMHFNVLNQMIAYEALKSGDYRQFTANMRKVLPEHYAFFNGLLDEHLGDIATWNRHSNIFFWIKFADYIDVGMMARRQEDIVFLDCQGYRFAEKNSLWMCPIQFSKEQLTEAVPRLSRLARKCIK